MGKELSQLLESNDRIGGGADVPNPSHKARVDSYYRLGIRAEIGIADFATTWQRRRQRTSSVQVPDTGSAISTRGENKIAIGAATGAIDDAFVLHAWPGRFARGRFPDAGAVIVAGGEDEVSIGRKDC